MAAKPFARHVPRAVPPRLNGLVGQVVSDVPAQGVSGLVPALGLLAQSLVHDRPQLAVHAGGRYLPGRRGGDPLDEIAEATLDVVREPAGQHLVEDHSQRVHIGSNVHGSAVTGELLRGRVGQGPHELPCDGDLHAFLFGSLGETEDWLVKLKEDLELFTLTCPAEGIVLYGESNPWQWGGDMGASLKPGGRVQPHQRLLTIPDLSGFKVQIQVNETDVNKVKEGQVAEIRPDAFSDVKLTGVIKSVGNVAAGGQWWQPDAVGKYDVEIEMTEMDDRIKPGMKCKVEILVEEVTEALFVPVEAVFDKEGKTVAYVVSGGDTDAHEVKVGRTSDDYAEILTGLEEGDEVTLYDPGRQ